MHKSAYFLPNFILLIVIAALHWISSLFGFYESTEWFDIMMHFLGGAWVSGTALWLAAVYLPDSRLYLVTVRNLVLCAIVVGIAWELFELVMGWTSFAMENYWGDTVLDLVMDVIGGWTMARILKKIF
ncbi:MAG: hypothetical protein Q8L64_03570 [bacterium]|nr:hypothetical protein [bacterium]